jgi:hypothetical protein
MIAVIRQIENTGLVVLLNCFPPPGQPRSSSHA